MVRFNHFNKDLFLKTAPTHIHSLFTSTTLCNQCHQFEIKAEFCILSIYAYGVQQNGFYDTSTFLTIKMCNSPAEQITTVEHD